MMGSAICVNCSIISCDCLFLVKQTERGPLYAFCFPRHYRLPCQTAQRLRSHKRRIGGESGRLNHDYYRFHLSRIVITVETWLAFKLGIINGPHVAAAYLVFECSRTAWF